jgi:nucleoside-diphosphate-sugar epimerase
MRVFVAGATGAVGRPLVRRLVEAGHYVVGTTRSRSRAEGLRAAGAEPVVVDALDLDALRKAIEAAKPDAVVHQLTALSEPLNPRRYEAWIAETNRLRREVTPTLVDAARAVGAGRVVAQNVAFMTAPRGPSVLDERAPLYTDAPKSLQDAVQACAALEGAVVGAEGVDGVVLRYGFFYGPGTSYAPDGDVTAQVRRRRFPIVGSGEGRFSFVHVEDAAAAAVTALHTGRAGVYNVCDDEPAPMREWVPEMARLLGARRPFRVPAIVARLAAGPAAVHYGTTLRGASNAKARRELGWRPEHPSWRAGFEATLTAAE